MKNKIYELYISDIAKLIAKIEVYAHDLPRQICGIIESIFRCFASAEAKDDVDKQSKILEIAYKYEIFLINTLYITLIYIYKKRIRNYKKTLRQFKHGGISLENGKPFMKYLEELINEGNSLFKEGKKKFAELYQLNWWETMFYCNRIPFLEKFFESELNIKTTVNQKIETLEKAYKTYDKAIALCEDKYATVINNGYQATLTKRIINSIPGIISFIITLITAVILLSNG